MAFVLIDRTDPDPTNIHGVRISADPTNESAEFAIIIQRELTVLGIGIYLMQRMIDYARKRGLREIYGLVLRENQSIRQLCRALGFSQQTYANDHNLVKVLLIL